MARNKRLQDREVKQTEILNAARTLFMNEGYEATSMSRIASLAGIAANTIYWYFKDKDELLIQILNQELINGLASYVQIQHLEITERLVWVIEQLQQVNQLVSTVHARLHLSSAIQLWHQQFHFLVENLLREELQQFGVKKERIEAKVKIAVFVVEGLLSHQASKEDYYLICRELLN